MVVVPAVESSHVMFAFAYLLATVLPVINSVHYVDSSPHGWCVVDIRYPQVSGITTAVEAVVNAGLKRRFLDDIKSEYPYTDYDEEPIAHPSMLDCERRMDALTARLEHHNALALHTHASFLNKASFAVGLARPSLISIVGEGLEASTPSAHPTTYVWTSNVDLSTGRILRFADMFKTDPAHRKRLDALIAAGLKEMDPSLVETFKAEQLRGSLNPLLCPGGVRFFDIFDVHAILGVTVFVRGRDLIDAGLLKDNVPLDVLREATQTSNIDCAPQNR